MLHPERLLLDYSETMTVAQWRKHHEHEVHTATAMTNAIAERFAIAGIQQAPYLYRYLIPVLPTSPDAADLVQAVLDDEALHGARCEIVRIGRRIVASHADRALVAATARSRFA